jgi:hypothetical protein
MLLEISPKVGFMKIGWEADQINEKAPACVGALMLNPLRFSKT